MILFLVLAAALWTLGHLMKAPHRARWLMIGLLYVAILVALVLLPPGHPFARTLGPLPMWLLLGAGAALALGYASLIRAIRRRAAPDPAPEPDGPFTDAELERYTRQILLREIGGPGQMRLKQAKVLVIGAGGLGCPALQYLAAAGVGTLGVIDDDTVSLSNLHRQILHRDDFIGSPKVFSATEALRAINPHVDLRPYNRRLTEEIAETLIAEYDLVLDGCDSLDTRYLVNRACTATRTPLISAAIAQWEGQLSLFDPAGGTPCYQCVFPTAPAEGLAPSCAAAGVAGPLPGVLGSMMALEAVKHLTGAGQTPRGEMIFYDGLWGEHRRVRLKPTPGCPVCGSLQTRTDP